MIDEIKEALKNYDGKWSEKSGVYKFEATIAERKAFLSKKKLTYAATMRIDDAAKELKFSEMLVEAGSGLSSGGFGGDDMSPGIGFKTESYNTMKGPREGGIKEQSDLFGKQYGYNFNYSDIRKKIEAVVDRPGYKLTYQTLTVK